MLFCTQPWQDQHEGTDLFRQFLFTLFEFIHEYVVLGNSRKHFTPRVTLHPVFPKYWKKFLMFRCNFLLQENVTYVSMVFFPPTHKNEKRVSTTYCLDRK